MNPQTWHRTMFAYMQDFNDSIYWQVAQGLHEGENLADYIVSLSVTAQKQEKL